MNAWRRLLGECMATTVQRVGKGGAITLCQTRARPNVLDDLSSLSTLTLPQCLRAKASASSEGDPGIACQSSHTSYF